MPDFNRWTPSGGDPSLNEINRADRFFEALAAKQPVFSTDPAEAELAFLFSEFRDDVRDAPVTAPVSAADAAEALRGGLARNRGPRRGFTIVGSVAAAMLCIGGFGTAVYGAGPGDSLYGMRTAIFGQQEQTRDDQVSLASAQLQQVQQLIDQGQWQQAQDKLVEVSSAVQGVDRVDSKQQLVEQWNALTYKVVEQDPAATLAPGSPLPALPSSPLTWLPVPTVESTNTGKTEPSASSDSSSTASETPSPSTSTPSPSTSDSVTSPSPSPSDVYPSASTPLPSSAVPSSSFAVPSSSFAVPSSSLPVPSASTPLPSPSTRLPSPSATAVPTPLPSQSAAPVPTPLPSPSAAPVPTPLPSAAPLPLPSAAPLPSPSALPVTSTAVVPSASLPRLAASPTPPSPAGPPSSPSVLVQPTPSPAAPERPSAAPTTTIVPRFGGVS